MSCLRSCGAVAAVCDLPVWAQVLSGIFVALFAFFTVRPVVRLYMHKGIKRTHTGPLVGRTVEVTEKIPAGQVGRIRLGDYEWQVLVVDGDEVGPGDRVEILKQNTDILKARKI